MRSGIAFTVSAGERQRLRTIVADPKSPQKHVWRARIVLLSSEGLGTSAIMAETGKSKTCVWRWQERFMHEGVGGLLRDKSRPPGKAPVPSDCVAWIIRQTQQPPPHEATHWTLCAMAKAAGIAASTVQAIWGEKANRQRMPAEGVAGGAVLATSGATKGLMHNLVRPRRFRVSCEGRLIDIGHR